MILLLFINSLIRQTAQLTHLYWYGLSSFTNTLISRYFRKAIVTMTMTLAIDLIKKKTLFLEMRNLEIQVEVALIV